MKITEIMTHDPACCIPENSLVEVAKMMKDRNCGAIPVVEDLASRKAVGIITDRDLVVRAMAEAKDSFITKVGDCMSKSLVTVGPEDDLQDCIHLMEKHQIRRILVVDERDAVVGIVVQAQIARETNREEAGEVLQEISKRSPSG